MSLDFKGFLALRGVLPTRAALRDSTAAQPERSEADDGLSQNIIDLTWASSNHSALSQLLSASLRLSQPLSASLSLSQPSLNRLSASFSFSRRLSSS